MKKIIVHSGLLSCLAALTIVAAPLQAEEMRIPLGHQADEIWNGKTPARGTSAAQVEAEFGSPDSKDGPTGNPPIYFWEYPDFTVYFESDYVIHSVIKHRPAVAQ